MTTLLALILFLIFILIALIHFYWGFGGQLGSESVFPTKDETTKAEMPGPIPTFIVALGLATIAIFILIKSHIIHFPIPSWLATYGLWILAGIFIIRAVGDFNYIGFFKKIKNTKFGRNDTTYYSPLCLLIGTLLITLEIISK